MNQLIIDTSAYSVFYRGQNTSLNRYFKNNIQITMPIIVIGELRAGFEVGNKRDYNDQNLAKFLSKSNVSVVSITHQTTTNYARIFAELRKQGTPIGFNDIWIAALSLEFDLPLLTLDNGFKHVPGLKIIDL